MPRCCARQSITALEGWKEGRHGIDRHVSHAHGHQLVSRHRYQNAVEPKRRVNTGRAALRSARHNRSARGMLKGRSKVPRTGQGKVTGRYVKGEWDKGRESGRTGEHSSTAHWTDQAGGWPIHSWPSTWQWHRGSRDRPTTFATDDLTSAWPRGSLLERESLSFKESRHQMCGRPPPLGHRSDMDHCHRGRRGVGVGGGRLWMSAVASHIGSSSWLLGDGTIAAGQGQQGNPSTDRVPATRNSCPSRRLRP